MAGQSTRISPSTRTPNRSRVATEAALEVQRKQALQRGPHREGQIERGYVICPWHGYDFALNSGKGIGNEFAVETLAVREQDEMVEIAVLAFMPDEERVQYSAMTGQSLFYMGEADLKHKILAIVEAHGGVIWAENIRPTDADVTSEPLGARFVVGLPI